MKSLAAPFRQLASGRLWPLALLLALAAVATPLLLADREELPPAPAAAVPTSGMNALQAALVTPAVAEVAERRRVLGARKDPFTPTGTQPKPARPAATADAGPSPSAGGDASPATGNLDPGTGFTGGGSPADTTAPSVSPDPPSSPSPTVPDRAPAPVVPPATPRPPAPTFALYSLKVRVNGEVRVLKRLDALPDAETPAAIYLGLLEDGKTAAFLVDADVDAEGDGRCDPNPDDCQRVYLRKGETEFFTPTGSEGGQELQVDLLDIRTKRTRSARKAQVARVASSSDGRRLLRERMSRVGRLRYNPRTGKLRVISSRGWLAAVARAAARP